MYRKNTASQFIGFAGVNASTGAAMSGTTGFAAYRVIDGGAQAAATGTVTDKTNGQYSFALSQADTNGNDISILFTMTGMVPVEKTFVTTAADPTDSVRLGLTSLPNAAASSSGGLPTLNAGLAVKADLDTIKTQAVTCAAGVTVPSSLASPTNITAGTITTVTNLTNLPAITAGWLTASGIAASALNGKGDWLLSSGYTAPPSSATIAAATWDLATSGHTTAGTFGNAMVAAGSAGDPWSTSLPGAYGAGTAGYIVGNNPDSSGVTTLLTRLSAGRATNLDNLDAAISTRSTYAGGAVASVTAPVTISLTTAVPTSNTAQTIGDCLNAARAQGFGKWAISGTTLNLYASDGTTVVRSFTLDSSTAPTSRT